MGSVTFSWLPPYMIKNQPEYAGSFCDGILEEKIALPEKAKKSIESMIALRALVDGCLPDLLTVTGR